MKEIQVLIIIFERFPYTELNIILTTHFITLNQ